VRDSTRDGRWSTYDVSVLKLFIVLFWGKCARMGNTLKIPSPTKLARLGHFPPASQAGRLADSVFYVYVSSLVVNILQQCVWAGWGGGVAYLHVGMTCLLAISNTDRRIMPARPLAIIDH
jgi:hypothetical protein